MAHRITASMLGTLTALPAPVLLRRTGKYDSVRASLAPCIALKHESLGCFRKSLACEKGRGDG
jgi:hypothetical protein